MALDFLAIPGANFQIDSAQVRAPATSRKPGVPDGPDAVDHQQLWVFHQSGQGAGCDVAPFLVQGLKFILIGLRRSQIGSILFNSCFDDDTSLFRNLLTDTYSTFS